MPDVPSERRQPADPLGDLAAWASVELLAVACRLGLLDALLQAPADGATTAELAEATGCDQAALRDLLRGLVAGRYVGLRGDRYRGSAQLRRLLAVPTADCPHDLRAHLDLALTLPPSLVRLLGTGVSGAEDQVLLRGISARLSAPVLQHFLLDHWIAAVPGSVDALNRGSAVLEVGCGEGHATRLIGDRFPRSHILGVDADPGAIDIAAAHPQSPPNARYQHAELTDIRGQFDMILLLHTLHELADPEAGIRQLGGLLRLNGSLIVVEASAVGDAVRDTVDRLSTFTWLSSFAHCVPASRARGGPAPGAMWAKSEILGLLDRSILQDASAFDGPGNRTVLWAYRRQTRSRA
jgi:SAM-dependent methyltransferase